MPPSFQHVELARCKSSRSRSAACWRLAPNYSEISKPILNVNAKTWIVEQLVRNITFKTVGGAVGQRKVVFTVSDGQGGLSAEATKFVRVT